MTPRVFADRAAAGAALAREMRQRQLPSPVLVLALPRGGVPIGAEIALALHAPLDVFNVRKLGVPWHDELAMGAIAAGGVRVLNNDDDPKDFQVYMGELYLQLHDPKAAAEELKVLESLCPEGCPQRAALSTSLAEYQPPAAVILPPPEPLSSMPEATAAPTPLAAPAPERD